MEFVSLHSNCSAPSHAIEKIKAFLAEHDLAKMDNGEHAIEGEDFYVNIFGYTTTVAEERIWEAHREYLDVHVLIEGSEVVRCAPLDKSVVLQYHAEKDYVEIASTMPHVSATLDSGNVAVFYPEDVHQTGLMVNNIAENIRKAVFKLRL